MRLIRLDSFTCLDPNCAGNPEAATRRFQTLLVPPAGNASKGGTGSVLPAWNTQAERFALKSVLPVTGNVGGAVARAKVFALRTDAFLEERREHQRVSGLPGFPFLYGWGTFAGGPVMLMEWVEGQTVSAVTAQLVAEGKRWEPYQIKGVATAVLHVLKEARSLPGGFVHRDLSGRNIMLRTTKRPLVEQMQEGTFDLCLIDLGSAVHGPVIPESDALPSAQRNATEEYAPPEMLGAKVESIAELRRHPSIDVYELCSILYEMYCGHTPYRVHKRTSIPAYQLKTGYAPEPLPLRNSEDEAFVKAILSGLSPSQSERPSIDDLLRVVS